MGHEQSKNILEVLETNKQSEIKINEGFYLNISLIS